MAGESSSADPCGSFTKVQRNAVVWFVVVVFGGTVLVSQFARIDRQMYDTNAKILDYGKFKENRSAQYAIPSESIDTRSNGTFPGTSVGSE